MPYMSKLVYDRDLAAQGQRAFRKLFERGGDDLALCEKWNAFTSDPVNIARREELAGDEEFMRYYLTALYADRVPAKRKAIREFLTYLKRSKR